jgi:hypothetical protein
MTEMSPSDNRERRWFESAFWMVVLWIVVVLFALFPFPWWF